MASSLGIEKQIVYADKLTVIEHKIIHADKLAIFTCNNEINEINIRKYVIKNWHTLTLGMENATILFIAGTHGLASGQLGRSENIQTLKNQFIPRVLKADWLLEDKEKRNIKFDFLEIPDFLKDQETKEIDESSLVSAIQSIDPQAVFMVICHSQILDLKFLLEGSGLFAVMRMNRDLNILSNGQILTMNDVQKEFIQTLADEDNVEKDVLITGPVGSGKTLLGLEAINIKKSHYKRKYGISPIDCQNKLRVIILIGVHDDGNMLKQQMMHELSKSSKKDCTTEIVAESDPDSQMKNIFQANENYKSFSHTFIMLDEITRGSMNEVSLEEYQNVDFIYCLNFYDAKDNSKTLEVNDTFVECNLVQRQRSSQEILSLADYLLMHSADNTPMKKYSSGNSFSSDIPMWVDFANPKSFFAYFRDKFTDCSDVMLIWDEEKKPINLKAIEEFCTEKKWRITECNNVLGSEASITILLDIYSFGYEHLTRAKNQLVIVTSNHGQSEMLIALQDIEKGKHDDKVCEEQCHRYKKRYGKELECEFKGMKSRIRNLIRKSHVDAHGNVTEIHV